MAEAPRELLADPDLPPRAKVCAVVLWSLVRRDAEDPQWWQTFAELADQMGCTERQARRAHRELTKRGWVWRKRHGQIFRSHLLRERSEVAAVLQPADRTPETARSADPDPPLSGSETIRSAVYVESPERAPKEPRDLDRQGQISLVTEPDAETKPEPIARRRRKAARVVWEAHEQRRVDRGIGRPAKGGGLRKPQKRDIDAIIRCAAEIRDSERLEEADAWRMLRDAAVAAVDAAADATARGAEIAEKLRAWRATNPFGGRKLGPMLAELEHRRPAVAANMSAEQAREWAEANGGRAPAGWHWNGEGNLDEGEGGPAA